MGLLDRLGDKAVEKLAKRETIRIDFEQMAQIVTDEFIKGNDDAFLKNVQKAAKGRVIRTYKLSSANDRYELRTSGDIPNILDLFLGRKKVVWIFDNETSKFYQLDKDRKWKKFYKSVVSAIKMERINRNR